MKTYTKEQIVEAFKSALPNSTALGRLLTHLEPLCGARNTSAGCSEVACTRTAGHTDTIPGVAQERHYNHERRVNWPAFKVGNRVRERRLGRYGFVSRVCDNGLLDVKLDSPKFQYELFQPNELEHIEAPMPQFKVGDRVRIENCPGYLQGELGCIHKVVSASEYLVRCDNGSFPSVHASWVKPAPQFKDGQRVRVRATGQVARIGAVLADGRFMVEGSAYGAVGLEPAPFKVGDRVRWKLSSSLPFCHGQVEYLSDERAGVQTDGQFVEVAERLLEAEPDPAFRVGDRVEVLATGSKGRVIKGQGASGLIVVMMESSVILYLDSKKIKFLEAMPMFRIGDRVRRKSDGAEGEVTQVKTNVLVNAILDDGAHLTNWKSDKFELLEPMPTFRVGDRVKWKGTAQTGTVSGVFAFGKLDVALDSGGWLSNYSPDGFELLEPAEPRTFIKHFLERVRGQEFTHEEAELLRTHIAIRERTPKPTELRCPFCGGTGSLSRNGNLWRLECIGCGAEVTAAANEDCKSKWGRRS